MKNEFLMVLLCFAIAACESDGAGQESPEVDTVVVKQDRQRIEAPQNDTDLMPRKPGGGGE